MLAGMVFVVICLVVGNWFGLLTLELAMVRYTIWFCGVGLIVVLIVLCWLAFVCVASLRVVGAVFVLCGVFRVVWLNFHVY